MSSSEDLVAIEKAAPEALAIVEKALNDGETEAIPDEVVQRLLTAGVRLFAN